MKRVVIFIGPPGSGKDTQADFLVREYGYVQMPSSQIIRKAFADHPDDPVTHREKILFDTGKWNSPEFVAKLMIDFIRAQDVSKGIIFSGSPRTVEEARAEIKELTQRYGLDQIVVLHLNLDKEEAKRRNVTRRVCKANGHPFPNTPEFANLTTCPKDGSELYVRALDNAEVFESRWNEHQTRTEPCVEVFKNAGIPIAQIDASRPIEQIHHDIVNLLERDKEAILS